MPHFYFFFNTLKIISPPPPFLGVVVILQPKYPWLKLVGIQIFKT